jgi:hypothetical protein
MKHYLGVRIRHLAPAVSFCHRFPGAHLYRARPPVAAAFFAPQYPLYPAQGCRLLL